MPASKQSFVCNRTRAKQLIMILPSLLFLVLISFLRHILFGCLLLQRKCIWHLVTPLWGVELMKADPSPSIRPHMVPTKNHTAAPKVTYLPSYPFFPFFPFWSLPLDRASYCCWHLCLWLCLRHWRMENFATAGSRLHGWLRMRWILG